MEDKILKSLRLLYVEDNLKTLKIITQILENYFEKVFPEKNGFDAYSLYKNENIDIIITDLEMPKMDGLSFISKIRSKNFHIPIIVFTAYTDKEHLLPCANYNIQGYIEKPISSQKLEKAFENILSYLNQEKIDNIELGKNIIYDIDNCKLKKEKDDFFLSKKEKLFLDLLIANKNNLVSYENIECILWENEDETMSLMALRTLVKSLRQKLGKKIIQNISGMGYLLKID